ncbi:MAG: hypothetical protein IJC83_06405 [Oscillospiraceae bacterium]|nr:hypothetical protein [Oscillospiraceae bacterium]
MLSTNQATTQANIASQTKSKLNIFPVLFILFIIIKIFGSIFSQSAEDVAMEFMKALLNNPEKMVSFLSEKFLKQEMQDTGATTVEEYIDKLKRSGAGTMEEGEYNYSHKTEMSTGVEVVLNITNKGGLHSVGVITLVKENGEWLVDNFYTQPATAKDVALVYMQAHYIDDDYMTVLELYSENAKNEMLDKFGVSTEKDLVSGMKKYGQLVRSNNGTDYFNVEYLYGSDENSNETYFNFKIIETTLSGKQYTDILTLYLIKENGLWKVDNTEYVQ